MRIVLFDKNTFIEVKKLLLHKQNIFTNKPLPLFIFLKIVPAWSYNPTIALQPLLNLTLT